MKMLKKMPLLLAVSALLLVTACSSTRPVPYAGITSSQQLRLNKDAKSDRVPYQYASPVRWGDYSNFILDGVAIYNGNDSQFEDVSAEEKELLAQYMEVRFQKALESKWRVINAPASKTIRVKVTLTGAKSNTRFLTTFLRFDIGGGPYNAVQAARDEEGLLTGSVSYAVEIYDVSSNRLLTAYVAKQFPNAWNIQATLGRLDASKVGIDKAADDLVARLN
ncbi:MAG: DUF3313 domain-containing protein [Rhodoferax sp.]|uniref:DUF3313 domain-containing protein n=2 Tax=Rhodoferax sp. TaxID=50421 RepID=UPI0032675E4A